MSVGVRLSGISVECEWSECEVVSGHQVADGKAQVEVLMRPLVDEIEQLQRGYLAAAEEGE